MIPDARCVPPARLLVFAILVLVAPGEAGATSMLPATVHDAGTLPRDVFTGDFNQDGFADLATLAQGQTGFGPADLRIFLGNGDGSFRAVQTIPLGTSTSLSLLGGDLNGDGRTDLVVDMDAGAEPFVFLANTDGTFQPVSAAAATGVPRILLADFTGDAKLDLLYLRGTTTATFEVLPGVGDGTFLPSAGGPVAQGSIAVPQAAADVNHDGKMDVLTGTTTGGSRTFLGNGNGTFSAVAGPAGPVVKAIGVADFDRDGHPDLVLGSGTPAQRGVVSMYRGNGDGTFQVPPAWTFNMESAQGGMFALVSGDINHDGWLDLVASNDYAFQVMLGIGGGNVALHESFRAGFGPWRVVLGDFDRRGSLDLAATYIFSFTMAVYLGDDDGNLLRLYSNPVPVPLATESRAALASDLDGDGVNDLAGAHCEGSNDCQHVAVAPGLPGGGFGPAALYDVGPFPRAMIAEDVNDDMSTDLLAVSSEDPFQTTVRGTLSVLIGAGVGGFLPRTTYTVGFNPYRVAAGDLDGDHDLDLVVANRGYFGSAGNFSILAGNGDGTFAAPAPFVAKDPRDVAIGDLNGDGRLDLATVWYGNPGASQLGQLAIYLGNGNLTFGARQNIGTGAGLTSLAMGDLDSDGDLDLVTSDAGDDQEGGFANQGATRVYKNNGTGTFALTSTLSGGFGPNEVRLQDLNEDGIPDLFVINGSSFDVSLFPGKGDGTFAPAERYSTYGYYPLLMTQYDADPRPDFVVGSNFEAHAVLNVGASTPQLRMGPAPGVVSWSGVPLCAGYDVVKGDLATLRTGGFPAAITGCPHPGGLTQNFVDPAVPAAGQGFFYIARAIKMSGAPGTYDTDGIGQVAPRDEPIGMSASACP